MLPHSNTLSYANVMDSYCWQRSMHDAYQAPQKSEIYQSKTGSWYITPALRQSKEMIYNFTGLGGTVRAVMSKRPDMLKDERLELAYATMRLAFEHIMSRVIMALENDGELLVNPPQSLVMAGGVASSRFLKIVATSMLQARGFGNVTVAAPRPQFCTDNAAMVAWAGLKMYEAGWTTDKSFLPQGEWPIEEIITGVDCWLQNGVATSPESTSQAAASQRDEPQPTDKSNPQDPPLSSTANVPEEPDAVAAPDAGAAPRRETNAKSATPTDDEVCGGKPKSDNKKPSARPDPGPSSAQDGQHAPDGEGPGSPQQDTARTPRSQAADSVAQSGRSPQAPTGPTRANPQPTGARRATEKQDDTIKQLQEAESQLFGLGARQSAAPLSRPRLPLGLRNKIRPVDGRIAKPELSGPPAWQPAEPRRMPRHSPGLPGSNETRPSGPLFIPASAKERAADGARREPKKESWRTGEALRALKQMGSAVDSELAAKAQPATPNRPQRRPSTIAPGEKNRANDGAKPVPLRSWEVKRKGEWKLKEQEQEKKEKRFVRLLPPAPAAEKAPEGSLRAGLNRLKSWIGL